MELMMSDVPILTPDEAMSNARAGDVEIISSPAYMTYPPLLSLRVDHSHRHGDD